MKRLLDRSYAAQRLAYFRRMEKRQQDEAIRGAGWAVFYLIVVSALLFSWLFGS